VPTFSKGSRHHRGDERHSARHHQAGESASINDLGIDGLDFLDIAFAIDKAFGIKLPLEQWTQEVNDGKATTEQYFVLNNLCTSIDGLVAAKAA
jgi:acyl carrier protein